MSDQPSPAQPDATAPTIIDRRYVLEQRLGGGGMGVVYRARDKLMEKRRDRDPYVALKLISESLRANEEARTLLQRECSRARKLSHPNIVRVFNYECDESTDSDYLTMELLRGEPLERLIRDHPSGVGWARASRAIEQLCNGLEYAHAEGIVHSDIKPSNLFMTDASMLKILDFGIAAPLRNADTASSETLLNPRHMGAVAPRYSSLEMFLGKDADPSDDVYSAACVIYELLTGQHPYQGLETPRAAELNLVPEAVPCLNRSQNRALRKALSFRRRERTSAIAELKAALLQPPRSMLPSARTGYAAAAAIAVAAAVAAMMVLQPSFPVHWHFPLAGSGAATAPPARPETARVPPSDQRATLKVTPIPSPHDLPGDARPSSSAPSAAAGTINPGSDARTGSDFGAKIQSGSAATIESASGPAKVPPQPSKESVSAPAAQTPAATPFEALPQALPQAQPQAQPSRRAKSSSFAGQKVQPAPIPPTNRSVSAEEKKTLDGRCASIVERMQLGETLSDEEHAYVRQKCN